LRARLPWVTVEELERIRARMPTPKFLAKERRQGVPVDSATKR
jgi:hypothetical protein